MFSHNIVVGLRSYYTSMIMKVLKSTNYINFIEVAREPAGSAYTRVGLGLGVGLGFVCECMHFLPAL